jgi:hypothetical protein
VGTNVPVDYTTSGRWVLTLQMFMPPLIGWYWYLNGSYCFHYVGANIQTDHTASRRWILTFRRTLSPPVGEYVTGTNIPSSHTASRRWILTFRRTLSPLVGEYVTVPIFHQTILPPGDGYWRFGGSYRLLWVVANIPKNHTACGMQQLRFRRIITSGRWVLIFQWIIPPLVVLTFQQTIQPR